MFSFSFVLSLSFLHVLPFSSVVSRSVFLVYLFVVRAFFFLFHYFLFVLPYSDISSSCFLSLVISLSVSFYLISLLIYFLFVPAQKIYLIRFFHSSLSYILAFDSFVRSLLFRSPSSFAFFLSRQLLLVIYFLFIRSRPFLFLLNSFLFVLISWNIFRTFFLWYSVTNYKCKSLC